MVAILFVFRWGPWPSAKSDYLAQWKPKPEFSDLILQLVLLHPTVPLVFGSPRDQGICGSSGTVAFTQEMFTSVNTHCLWSFEGSRRELGSTAPGPPLLKPDQCLELAETLRCFSRAMVFRVWFLDWQHLKHQWLWIEMQICRPHLSTKSETLGVEARNLRYNKPPSGFDTHWSLKITVL